MLQASDGSSSTPYQIGYDTSGRANSFTDQLGRNTQVAYDGAGNQTEVVWPAGTSGTGSYSVTYQYDAMNRMQYVHEGGTNKLLAQYSWDALSRTRSIAYGDGTSDAYSQYDAGDNLQTLTQTYNGSNSSVTFNYTWLMNQQLNSAGVNNPLFQYVPQADTISYGTANADNGLTTMTASTGTATMTYDGNHNLTFDGTNTLSYDVENRMVQAENLAWGESTYVYDPLGQRRQKVVGVTSAAPVATDFVLAGSEEIADYYETSATWRLMVRGAGGLPLVTVVPVAGGESEEIVYVHHDVKGSTVALTEPGGSGPAETYTYSDYGQPQNGSWLAYQYASYRYDSETGLYYMPARYYSPALGRFLQADPIGFSGGFNLYAYAGNDPINQADPTGLTPDGSLGFTVTLSESVATPFMSASGGPSSVTICATATITCSQALTFIVDSFLKKQGVPIAWSNLAGTIVQDALQQQIDPRLISSILALESGNGKRFSGNNPFGLGPGNRYKSPQLAIAQDAYTLNHHVYGPAGQTTVTSLYSGNRGIYSGKYHEKVTQYPAYCTSPGCPAGGQTVAGFMTSQGGDPNKLNKSPCP